MGFQQEESQVCGAGNKKCYYTDTQQVWQKQENNKLTFIISQ